MNGATPTVVHALKSTPQYTLENVFVLCRSIMKCKVWAGNISIEFSSCVKAAGPTSEAKSLLEWLSL